MMQRVARSQSSRPPSRENKRAVTTYVPPEVLKQLKQLALDRETSVQDLGAEALNLLFKKYRLEQIA